MLIFNIIWLIHAAEIGSDYGDINDYSWAVNLQFCTISIDNDWRCVHWPCRCTNRSTSPGHWLGPQQQTSFQLTVYIQQQQHPFNGPFPGLPRWAGTRKVKPIWILLKQETVSGRGISWAICKSAPSSRQINTPALHHSVFYRPDVLPAAQPTASKHWMWLLLLRLAVTVYI